MAESILVTGGAGFIGSHLVDALVTRGLRVTVLDALVSQVHGGAERPTYLHPDVELIQGDVRDVETVAPILDRVDVVFHLAAMVGVGQSMYEITRYTSGNTLAAAALLQAVIDAPRRVRKMVVASSMSIYGEGEYTCSAHRTVAPRLRPESLLRARQWEPCCPSCGEPMTSIPTTESKPLYPSSIYAINKRYHEEMFLVTGQATASPPWPCASSMSMAPVRHSVIRIPESPRSSHHASFEARHHSLLKMASSCVTSRTSKTLSRGCSWRWTAPERTFRR